MALDVAVCFSGGDSGETRYKTRPSEADAIFCQERGLVKTRTETLATLRSFCFLLLPAVRYFRVPCRRFAIWAARRVMRIGHGSSWLESSVIQIWRRLISSKPSLDGTRSIFILTATQRMWFCRQIGWTHCEAGSSTHEPMRFFALRRSRSIADAGTS